MSLFRINVCQICNLSFFFTCRQIEDSLGFGKEQRLFSRLHTFWPKGTVVSLPWLFRMWQNPSVAISGLSHYVFLVATANAFTDQESGGLYPISNTPDFNLVALSFHCILALICSLFTIKGWKKNRAWEVRQHDIYVFQRTTNAVVFKNKNDWPLASDKVSAFIILFFTVHRLSSHTFKERCEAICSKQAKLRNTWSWLMGPICFEDV